MRKRKKKQRKKEEKEIWSFQEQRNSVSIQNVYKILSPETNKRNKTHCLKKQRNTKSQETKKHEVSRSKKYVWRYKKHETKYGG